MDKVVVAIGGFDALHIGHQKLIKAAITMAEKLEAVPSVLTFDENLDKFKNRESFLDKERRLEIFKNLGIKKISVLPFDEKIKNLTPGEFVEEILGVKLNACGVVVGENFRFGKDVCGTAEDLKNICKKIGIETFVCPLEKTEDGEVISTTLLKKLLKEGKVSEIKKLCNAPYMIKGRVTHGRNDGKTFGVPTANLKATNDVAFGVYASEVLVDEKKYAAVTSIGTAPTFGCKEIVVENHLLGYEGDLYEKEIAVFLHKKIRDIKKFDNIESLKEQIKKDIEVTKYLFDTDE